MAKCYINFSLETRTDKACEKRLERSDYASFKKKNTYLGTVFDIDNVVSTMLLR